MNDSGYWARLPGRRITRRRALAAAGAGAAGLALAACGGKSEKVSSDIAVQGGLAQPKDTSAIAVRGGVYKNVTTRDTQTFDVGATSNFTAYGAGSLIYSRILKSKSGMGIPPVTAELDGDLAEGWEVGEDGTRWTFRLRPNIKMHNVAPLNGRALDIEDVSLSWQRFAEKNPRRIRFDMVEKIETPDARTISYKLKFPYAPFGVIMADFSSFWVMPKEVAQEKVDYRGTGAGSGPWVLEEYRPSAYAVYRRHEDYFLPGLPYMDKVEYPIVSEYATRLAQFKAGNIYEYTPIQNDVVNLRADLPDALIYQGDFTLGWPVIFQGRTDPVWKSNGDIRLRRALSVAIDRDLYIDALYGVSDLQKAGFANIEARWHNMVGAGWPWWLDPKSKEFGWPDKEPAKWLKYDPVEAKALLSAAGYPNGIDSEVHYWSTFLAGGTFRMEVETTLGFWSDVGIRLKQVGSEQAEYLDKIVALGDFKGITVSPSGEYNEVDSLIKAQWTLPSDRNPPGYDDPEFNAMFEKQRRTFDMNERKAIIWEMQKWLAQRMWYVPWGGQATSSFNFVRPWVQNVQVFRASPDSMIRRWMDPSKMKG